jgi:hypothetical protein
MLHPGKPEHSRDGGSAPRASVPRDAQETLGAARDLHAA